MTSLTPLVLAGVSALFCWGRAPLPIAMWLMPLFLLRFAHASPTSSGFALMFVVLYVAVGVMSREMTPIQGPPYFAFILVVVVMQMLPYLADRALAPRLPGFASTFVFPLTWVSVEFLIIRVSPTGSWVAMAYSQYGNLPLMQVASVTGLSGITFLVAWFASTINWAWDQHFAWESVGSGVLAYAGVLGVVMLAGAARVAFAASDTRSLRAAAISYPNDLFVPGEVTRILKAEIPADQREAYRARKRRDCRTGSWRAPGGKSCPARS